MLPLAPVASSGRPFCPPTGTWTSSCRDARYLVAPGWPQRHLVVEESFLSVSDKRKKTRPFSDLGQKLQAWQQHQGQPDRSKDADPPKDARAPKQDAKTGPALPQSERPHPPAKVGPHSISHRAPHLSDEELFSQAIDAISDASTAILQKYSREDLAGGIAVVPPGSQTQPQESARIADRALFLQAVGELTPMDVTRGKPASTSGRPNSVARFATRVQRGDFQPQATIDLHGDSREQAETRLRNFLRAEQQKRSETVLVVHGKGLGILATEVREVLDAEACVAEHVGAPPAWGGDGARVVRLKNKQDRRTR